jgi:hypothetical protein
VSFRAYRPVRSTASPGGSVYGIDILPQRRHYVHLG